jgi:chromosome segregation ATPase
MALAAAAPALRASDRIHVTDRGDSFILSQGESGSISSGSFEHIRAIDCRFSGEYLWASRGGREVLIRDRATLDEAASLFARLQELEPEQQALEKSQRDLEKRQNALEREQEQVDEELDAIQDADDDDDAPPVSEEARRADEDRRRQLEDKRRDLEKRARPLEAEERELESKERSIDARSDEIERQAEAKLWALIDRAIADGRATDARNR